MFHGRLNGCVAAILLLTALACGDEELPPIVGDWFHCTTVDCGVLGIKGSRFEADGALLHLYPEKPVLDDAGGYCHTTSPDLQRTYTLEGEALTVYEPSGGSFSYVFVIEDDVARSTREGTTNYLKRVAMPRDRGSCSTRTPLDLPQGAKGRHRRHMPGAVDLRQRTLRGAVRKERRRAGLPLPGRRRPEEDLHQQGPLQPD